MVISIIPFYKQIPFTRIKIAIAKILYRLVKIFYHSDQQIIVRNGLNYQVDLSEGIDLSIFLFGDFQKWVHDCKNVRIPPDGVILDVGANIGTMSLQLAVRVPHGLVYAFEPTDYAFAKLIRNISLNPDIAGRIRPFQIFISDHDRAVHTIKAYSSWKIDGSGISVHPLHGGSIKPAASIPSVTIDHFCEINNIYRIDFIKIDTDGHEYQVLKGAEKTLKNYHPYIVFEIGFYLMKESGVNFEEYYNYLSALNYYLVNSKNDQIVSKENYHRQIPYNSTTDLIAIPTVRGSGT
ncbi:MAG: FkbM family methyltransferase [Bacteroidota bacterium]